MNVNNNVVFPVYRKYKNGHSFFKIHSDTIFDEIKVIGERIHVMHIIAEKYPERVFIQQMLHDFEQNWDVVSPDEYEQFLNK